MAKRKTKAEITAAFEKEVARLEELNRVLDDDNAELKVKVRHIQDDLNDTIQKLQCRQDQLKCTQQSILDFMAIKYPGMELDPPAPCYSCGITAPDLAGGGRDEFFLFFRRILSQVNVT